MIFFNSYFTSSFNKRELVDNYYSKLIEVSRKKDFYTNLSVPDTIDGRFDLLALFSILFTFFLSRCGTKGIELSQTLFDKIFLDLDLSLRELGAGDAGVHIKIKNMVSSYMGRQKVYSLCFETEDFKKLEKHIVKNIYRNVEYIDVNPKKLADYCKKCVLNFKNKSDQYFLQNKFNFPDYE